MSLNVYSRYRFCRATEDANGNRVLDTRSRFLYRDRQDTIAHLVADGDTLESLAARYYAPWTYSAQLFWVIGDFQVDSEGQPAPVYDPTVALTPGSIVLVPGKETVQNEALSPDRASEHDRA